MHAIKNVAPRSASANARHHFHVHASGVESAEIAGWVITCPLYALGLLSSVP
jgi:hypothetical protein